MSGHLKQRDHTHCLMWDKAWPISTANSLHHSLMRRRGSWAGDLDRRWGSCLFAWHPREHTCMSAGRVSGRLMLEERTRRTLSLGISGGAASGDASAAATICWGANDDRRRRALRESLRMFVIVDSFRSRSARATDRDCDACRLPRPAAEPSASTTLRCMLPTAAVD